MVERVITHQEYELPDQFHKLIPALLLETASKKGADGQYIASDTARLRAIKLLVWIERENARRRGESPSDVNITVNGDMATALERVQNMDPEQVKALVELRRELRRQAIEKQPEE